MRLEHAARCSGQALVVPASAWVRLWGYTPTGWILASLSHHPQKVPSGTKDEAAQLARPTFGFVRRGCLPNMAVREVEQLRKNPATQVLLSVCRWGVFFYKGLRAQPCPCSYHGRNSDWMNFGSSPVAPPCQSRMGAVCGVGFYRQANPKPTHPKPTLNRPGLLVVGNT